MVLYVHISETNLCHRRDIVDARHGQDVQDDVGDADLYNDNCEDNDEDNEDNGEDDVGNADKEHRGAEENQSGWAVVDPAQSRFTFTMIMMKMGELCDAKRR